MKVYRIMKRSTKDWWEGSAESAQDACNKAGWWTDDCWVRVKSYIGAGGWKKVREEEQGK